jgi:hypothetical protein
MNDKLMEVFMVDSYVVAYENGWAGFFVADPRCPYSAESESDLWHHFQVGWNDASDAYNRNLMKAA